MKKGVSPLIATVLLIAFTIAVAGIISIWLTGFARTTTSTIGSQANIEIICNNGQISLSNLKYCNNYFSGDVSNSGTIDLGNITLQIMYMNGSQHPKLYLSLIGSTVNASSECCGNLTVSPAEKYRFNTTPVNNNYDLIRVVTNCTAKVTDEASRSDVSGC